ncbi:ferrous iron transport protein A [Candidatus Omnitrophota bacterium]
MMNEPDFPLNQSSEGREVVLAAIEGGQKLKMRLKDMGLKVGMTIKVLQAHRTGPCIILAGQTRLIIGRGMAHKLLVREL